MNLVGLQRAGDFLWRFMNERRFGSLMSCCVTHTKLTIRTLSA